MTATISTAPDVTGALKRADSRFNRRTGDDPAPAEYIDALAHAVQTLLGKAPGGATPPVDDELADLRHQNGQLADEVERLTQAASAHEAAVTSSHADLGKHQRLLEERDRRVRELSDRVQELLDALEAAQHAARVPAEPHRHQYPWAEPGTYPTPCACGQPYPRTNMAVAPAPKAAEPEPFAALFSRVRGQLAGWPVAS